MADSAGCIDRRRPVVLGIFILSGAAGLVYEIVWSRQLVLVFGNTTQAVSAILTGFFGGMAIGAARRPDRRPRPLAAAAVRDAGARARRVVLVTPLTFGLIHEVYRGVYPALEGTPSGAGPASAGRPGAGAGDDHHGRDLPGPDPPPHPVDRLSKAFGRLYSANTLGAIVGTLLAGLVLIEVLGLTRRAPRSGPPARRSPGSSPCGSRARTATAGDDAAEPPRAEAEPPTPTAAASPTRSAPSGWPSVVALRLRPDVARLPGALDAAAVVGHGQPDLRLHGDPRRCSWSASPSARRVYTASAPRIGTRSGCSRSRRSRSRSWRSPGSSSSSASPARSTRASRSRPLWAILGPAMLVVLPVDDRDGLHVPGVVGAAAATTPRPAPSAGPPPRVEHGRRDRRDVRRSRSSLIPRVGSPAAVALLALVNVALGDRPAGRWSTDARPRRRPSPRGAVRSWRRRRRRLAAPGTIVDPSVARIARRGRQALRLDARTRSRPSRPARSARRRELWVDGHVDDAAHGRREAHADPAAHRPAASRSARWSSRSGWDPRSAPR